MNPTSIQASLLGTRLTLLLGPSIAVPAPALIVDALSNVEVNLSDDQRDGFELTFSVGRTGVLAIDYTLMTIPLLKPPTRVVIQVWLGVVPKVLIDGFITRTQLNPGDEPGTSTLKVFGEDLRVLMDMHEISVPRPGMSVVAQVMMILAQYAFYLGAPPLVPPSDLYVPLPTREIPAQASTDFAYLQKLADERACVFYVEPTPVPMVNLAYWGIPPLVSEIQPALSVNMGPETNAKMSFEYDGLTATMVLGAMQDKTTQAVVPIARPVYTRPPLAPLPPIVVQMGAVRTVMPKDIAGLDPVQALLRAQAQADASSDVVTAIGELDMLRYGDVLRPRRRVGVRGAGYMFDGLYYVKNVKHSIRKGEYTQRFTLKRNGLGSLTPVLPT